MEYAAGGTLAQHVKGRGPLGEGCARFLFQQLIHGLLHCHHTEGVSIRDIKLENALLMVGVGVGACRVCVFACGWMGGS